MDLQEPFDRRDGNRAGFWRTLSAWLQPWKRRRVDPAEPPDQLLIDSDEPPPAARGTADLSWPRRRGSQLTRLEAGFDKLVTLADAIDQHLQKQADRSEQLIGQSRRLTDTLAQAHGLQKQQTEAVEEMANQYRTQTRQMQQVAESVEALPRAIKHQSEQLGQVRDQLEAQLEAQLSTAQGIQQLTGSADVLRNLADEQRRHFQQLQEASQSASLQLADALDRQGRRFTWLLAIAVAAALASIIGSAVAIFMVLARMAK